jgi:DNA-binding GntR family transcriptional regulator
LGSRDLETVGPLQRITTHSASQAAAQMLRKAIINGALRPGARLVELKLASAMGIGQPTLREALKELEYEGFVRKVPQRGTYVTKLEKDDYRKILIVRLTLEGLAVELAVRNLNPADEAEIAALVEDMASATANSDLAQFHEKDVAFHRKIWDLASNEYLTKALESISFPLFAFSLVDHTPKRMVQRKAAVLQHAAILAGLRSHDPAEARQAFVKHTVSYWNELHHFDLKAEEVLAAPSIQEPVMQLLAGGGTPRRHDGGHPQAGRRASAGYEPDGLRPPAPHRGIRKGHL